MGKVIKLFKHPEVQPEVKASEYSVKRMKQLYEAKQLKQQELDNAAVLKSHKLGDREEVTARMAKIKTTIQKINKVMAELKEVGK